MSNLASSYSALGRHEDALAMRERVLEFKRRVLPENHPDIGEGRVGSCVAVFLILLIVYDVFVSSSRLLSLDVIAASACSDISRSLERTGALPRALEAAREALRIRQATLPPGHKDVSDAGERVRKLEQATR
jgi:hypothetical protein